MSTEQSAATDSAPQTVESRLESYFGAPIPPPVEDQQEEAPEEAQEETEDEEEQAPAAAEIDFEADDGSVIKLPAAAKEAVLRRQDYTQKTQQLAVQQKLADDALQYAEALKQLLPVISDDYSELKSIEREIAQYHNLDWDLLYQSNPGQAFALQQKQLKLEKDFASKEKAITGKAQAIDEATKKHRAIQWAEAEKGARQLIGTMTQAENVAMAETVRSLGFTPEQFKEKASDPRLIAAIYKAAKWDALQANKSASVAKTANAPPVVKAGAVSGMPQQVKQELAFRKQMKSASNSTDRAKLIEQRLTARYK
jgi:hypothetical protein